MNKLVLATAVASALFGASYGATGAIESQNIVGYQTKSLQAGFTMTGVTFLPVTGNGVDIQSIIPAGDNIDTGDVNIQTLNAFGQTDDMYTYYGEGEYDDDSVAGWYTDDGLASVSFAPGQGLWVAAPDKDTTITCAGTVGRDDVVIKLQNGFTATANMMPVTLPIEDVIPSGDNINTGDVNIQTLNAFGQTEDMYTYYGEDEYDDGSVAGWYTDDGLASVSFAPGQGLWVAAPDETTKLYFPAPEL